jgi:hypothetical protein
VRIEVVRMKMFHQVQAHYRIKGARFERKVYGACLAEVRAVMAGSEIPHGGECLSRDIYGNDRSAGRRRERKTAITGADIKNPTGRIQRLKKRPINPAQAGRIDHLATRATTHRRMHCIIRFAKGLLRRFREQVPPPHLLDLSLLSQMISCHWLHRLS